MKEGRAVSEQSPRVTQSVGAHEEIYFLIARIVNIIAVEKFVKRRVSGHVGRRKSRFFRRRRKAGSEGEERGHEVALKDDLWRENCN